MTPESIIDIFRHMLYFVIAGAVILVMPGLVIGLLVSIFQAATQINEATLSFLPKIITTLAIIAILSPWLIKGLSDYTKDLVLNIPYLIG